MRLTSYTDYSLRTLMYLATVDREKLTSIKEISNAYSISYNHLTKVGHELSKLHLIESVKGRNGGIRLSAEPKDINIGWVVRQTEDNFHMVECFSSENTCLLAGGCELQSALREALNAYLAVLDQYTLEDVTANNARLFSLFQTALQT
ncbi:BadM/Rrf2 family transcriptional regulator [Sinobaca qinghaiensis]|uniref:HTH-type transcriptional regulator NsrR n=1 Tax=Sinobaca qinghaiensis TaxID=342944 RepID=A0A419V6M9_9BACL|nr:Rrf2 family transcriptional regulator [Sinobaca qinghaiensis]RKD75643.1 BadM/Rrf2 family transcriptional regulator [Sinobaca qinghaiensis]